MVTNELIAYLQDAIVQKKDLETLTRSLTSQGWTQQDIIEGLNHLIIQPSITKASPMSNTQKNASLYNLNSQPLREEVRASIQKRVLNNTIDTIMIGNMLFKIAEVINLLFMRTFLPNSSLDESFWSLIIIYSGIIFSYFFIMETLFSKTIGKYITKTKVVAIDGSKPSLKNILIRSLIRLIPIDQFTFLFSKYPIGWHDKFSGTIVIDEKKYNLYY